MAINVEKSSKASVSQAVVEFSRSPETALSDVATSLPRAGTSSTCSTGTTARLRVHVRRHVRRRRRRRHLRDPRDPGLAEDMRAEGRVPVKNQAPSPDGLTVEQIFTSSAASVPAS
ncbi:hypothetical protein MOQ72_04230 [Saccharopolyspora sp. K220]|uniref:hypothetical protein n=1 Tax=Saccharopolyspora soli TaxID=2926618 RepID=UPI001F5AA5AF|nr:hypothetical protein [Saccharopolyspora soli]MCI2416619.1 hypothetical protein [Saccharopolyspora soli]